MLSLRRWVSELQPGKFVEFHTLFKVEEGRMGVVVSLLAVLELVKEQLAELAQAEAFGPIYVHPRTEEVTELSADDDNGHTPSEPEDDEAGSA